MEAPYKKMLLLLIGLGILALAIVLVVYDQLPQSIQLNFDNQSQGTPLESQDSAVILKGVEEDLSIIERDYNFKQQANAEDLTAPNFAEDLNTQSNP